MTKELLILHGARHAVLKIIDSGSCAYAKRMDDGTWKTIEWSDICDYLTEIIEKYKAESEDEE